MSDDGTSGDVIRRYALGALSGAQLEEAETRLLTDDDFADDLDAIEAELADEYVAGELTASEHAQFAERLRRSATLRERVAAAHILADAGARHRPTARANAFGRWLLAAAAGAVIMAGGFWMTRSTPVVPPAGGNAPAPVPTPPAVTTPDPRPAPVATIVLFGAVVRDETTVPAFVVRDTSGQVRIEIHLDAGDDYPSYDVAIETGSGRIVTARQAMSAAKDAGGPVVIVEVPAEQLPPGRYAARISGRRASTATLIALYPFRSTR